MPPGERELAFDGVVANAVAVQAAGGLDQVVERAAEAPLRVAQNAEQRLLVDLSGAPAAAACRG